MTLAVSLAWGYQVAHKVFAERDRFCLPIVSLCLGLVSLLGAGAYLRRWLAPEQLWLPTCALLFGGWLLLRARPAPALETTRLSPAARLFLLLGWPIVGFYALFELSTGMVVDGDFFVHVASIGLFEEGHYPPLNYFLGIPTGGHFGRQLLIAQVARFSGLPFLSADWVLTSLLMLLTFSLLTCLLFELTRSDSAAIFGTAMGFFAANTGSRIGLVDTLGNHNPVAFFMLITVSWAVLRALRVGGLALPFAAAVLGLQGMVYETHFGLVGLTMPLTVLTVAREHWWRTAKHVMMIGVMALGVAATTGGAFTDLATRSSGPGEARQQQVSATIPKDRLWMLRADNMRPSRPFEGKMRPWSADFSPTQAYTFALGSRIRDLFWYPTWLFPAALAVCLVRRVQVGVWFAGLALWAWLIPSVVDFGFFEGEALRWLFVTGVGGAVVFGVTVGVLWDGSSRRWWQALLLALALWFSSAGLIRSVPDMVWALSHPGEPLPIGRPGVVPGVGLVPNPQKLLAHHYGLTDDDFQAAQWLRDNTPRQARVLADDDQESVNSRCTMFGLSGRLPAGYLPQVTDSTEPSGYRRSLQVARFWQQGDSRLLQGLGVDWLVVHRSRHSAELFTRLSTQPGLELQQKIGEIAIYSCRLPQPPESVEPLRVTTASFRNGVLTVRASHLAPSALHWVTVGLVDRKRRLVGGPQWLPISTWEAGSERTLALTLLAPHEAGIYDVALWGGRAAGTEPSVRLDQILESPGSLVVD